MVHRFRKLGVAAAATAALFVPLVMTGCPSSEEESARPAGPQGISGGGEEGAAGALAPFTSDPITAVGHGAMLVPGRGFIAPTPEFVRAAQAYYIDRLRNQAGPEVQAEFHAYRQSEQASEDSEFVRNAQLIAWLIERVNPADGVNLDSINRFMANAMAGESGGSGLRSVYQLAEVGWAGDAYTADCVAAGVPRPPAWRDPAWVSQGQLKNPFISRGQYAEVFTYISDGSETPPGVCFALPRSAGTTKSGPIPLLGIICQGAETSRACFWDDNNKKTITWEDKDEAGQPRILPIDEWFVGGTALAAQEDICTNCHRGENVFNIHPKSALDLETKLKRPVLTPKGWTTPIVVAGWPQNRKPSAELNSGALGDGSCASGNCHNKIGGKRFAELNDTACQLIDIAVGRIEVPATMPADGPFPQGAAGLELDTDRHWAVINSLCARMPLLPSTQFNDPKLQTVALLAADRSVLGDFDYDGRADLARIDAAGVIHVSLARGSNPPSERDWDNLFKLREELLPAKEITLATEKVWQAELPASITHAQTGDVSGDGADDLVFVAGNTVSVVRADPSAQAFIEPVVVVTSEVAIDHVLVADFDNNRKDDVAVFTASGVTLHLSNGSKPDQIRVGAATEVATSYATGRYLPLAGDVNGDAFADLVLVPTSQEPIVVGLARLRGVGFDETLDLVVSAQGASVALADVDGDGLGDLVGTTGAEVLVYRANDPGAGLTFGAPSSWADALNVNSIRVRDLNADGHADLVAIDARGGVRTALANEQRSPRSPDRRDPPR